MSTKKQKTIENEEGVMTLTGHLKELRNRIIVCLVVLVAGVLICFDKASQIVDMLVLQGQVYGYQFIAVAPQEMIIQYLKVAVIGSIVITLPVLLFQIWAFLKPGLKKNENTFFFLALVFGLICFVIGVLFAHKITLPFMLRFLYGVNTSPYITMSITVENYLSFVLLVYLIFGMVFEMPMLSIVLTQMGLLRPEWMKAARPYMIIVIFFIAAVITPPDPVSQIMVAIPMCLLYQLSIYLCKIFRKRKDDENDEEEEESED